MKLEILDQIWNNSKPCECRNDDNWQQDIKGPIYCNGCNSEVKQKGDHN